MGKAGLFLGVGLAFSLLGWVYYDSQQAPAAEAPRPLLQYDFQFPDPVYSHDLSTAEIGRLGGAGQSPEDGRIPGITLAHFDLGSSFHFDYHHPLFSGTYRLWLSDLTVRFAYEPLNVYVTREYAEGTCQYRTILDHENDHVAIHRRLFLKYQAILRQALEAPGLFPDETHPIEADSLEEGRARLEKEVSGVLDPIFAQFRQEVADEQGQLDTPINYEIMSRQCPGW